MSDPRPYYLRVEHLDRAALDMGAWFNLVGDVGGALWIVTYFFVIRQGFKDRTYALPMFAIGLNFSWEMLFAFVWPVTPWVWRLLDKGWLIPDSIIVFQLLRYGRGAQTNSELRKHFYLVFAVIFLVGLAGQYTFTRSYPDRMGLLAAFLINLVMSILFIPFYFARRAQGGRGLSKGVAWCKMLGTLGTSIEMHFVIPKVDLEMADASFLAFLSSTILLFDLVYVYLVSRPASAASVRTS
jgi:hypothetical protein